MSKRILGLFVFVFSTIILTSCSHTNNLSKYKVAGAPVIFRVSAKEGGSAYSSVSSPSKNVIVEIVSAVGSGVASELAQKKLNRVVNPDSIAMFISQGMKFAMIDYLNIKPVKDMSENPEYIVETKLTKYQIISNEYGLSANACGNSRIIHRSTGAIVWEDDETHSFTISDTWLAIVAPNVVKTGTSVMNAVKLNSMKDEDLSKIIDMTGIEVGKKIGETLRNDISKMYNK